MDRRRLCRSRYKVAEWLSCQLGKLHHRLEVIIDSKQTVATLSTAEAELYAATLGWQIVEGLRLLVEELGVSIPTISVMIDNQAALTIAVNGSGWRTRYFGCRGDRLHQEQQGGRARLLHCPTKDMMAAALTKLAAAPVISALHDAMAGVFPVVAPPGPSVSDVRPTPPTAKRVGDQLVHEPIRVSSCFFRDLQPSIWQEEQRYT